ncbi:MAG: ribonuclease E/G, partial [Gammaproteobacteria bacterium]
FMQQVMPQNMHKLNLYQENDPLFTKYQIENQIETAFSREVRLPSGGSLIFDHTEALLTIDINSARATRGSDIEETALNTNREAAEEIARQLRLRDAGGLIVIDFIDMMNNRNQREVENCLRENLKVDRARVQIGKISRFGLLEMSRQRLRPSLGESSHTPCPRCDGQGSIRGIESLTLSVLRILEEEAMKDLTTKVVAQLPVDAATYLLNEKRQAISEIEHRLDVEIILIPSPSFETPQYHIERTRLSAVGGKEIKQASYKLTPEAEKPSAQETITSKRKQQQNQPAIKQIIPDKPAPGSQKTAVKKAKNLISRLFGSLFGVPEKKAEIQQDRKRHNTQRRRRPNRGRGTRPRDNNRDQSAHNIKSGGQQRSGNRKTSQNTDSENKRNTSDRRRGRRGGRKRQKSTATETEATKQSSNESMTTHDQLETQETPDNLVKNTVNPTPSHNSMPESDSFDKFNNDAENIAEINLKENKNITAEMKHNVIEKTTNSNINTENSGRDASRSDESDDDKTDINFNAANDNKDIETHPADQTTKDNTDINISNDRNEVEKSEMTMQGHDDKTD